MGIKAYDYWLEKINEENVNSHGNWWTSSVWAENRMMASKYMYELKDYIDQKQLLEEIASKYKVSSKLFEKIAVKDKTKEEKVTLIKELKNNEKSIYPLLKELIS